MKPRDYLAVSFDNSPGVRECEPVKPNRVRLFIKPYCPWCHKAIHWLNERGVQFETVDVVADEAAYEEMIQLSGQKLAPVIDVDGEILADFGPEELAKFWEKISATDGHR